MDTLKEVEVYSADIAKTLKASKVSDQQVDEKEKHFIELQQKGIMMTHNRLLYDVLERNVQVDRIHNLLGIENTERSKKKKRCESKHR